MSSLQPILQPNLQNQKIHPLLNKPSCNFNLPSLISSSKSSKRRTIQACLSSNSQPGGVCPMANRSVAQSSSKPDEKEDDSAVRLPPGPWKLPFIGNILQLVGDLPHRRLRDLATIYGPVMSVQLGEVYAVIISSVETAKEVLRTQDVNFADRPPVLVSEIVLYNRQDIVFGAYGDHWRQMRRICTMELLSIKRVQSFKSVREEEVSDFIKWIYSKAGRPVNLTEKLFALTNSIMLRTSIGKKCRDQDKLLRVIEGVVAAGGGFSVADVFPSAVFLHDITGDKSGLESLRRDADLVLDEIIGEHRAVRRSGGDEGEAENLLDVLLELQENGNLEVPLNDDSIKGAILDMFGAGSDTSSKSTEWALSELLRHPEAMKKAQDEVRKVFSKTGNVEEEGLNQLKYLKLVIKETLRLHPAIPLIPRECREKTKVNGYDILPKTKALVNIWAISRDPSIWPEPEKFIPERFENSSMDFKGNHCEFAPFGSGKRICPGMALGITNLELFLAQLLYHFDWQMADGKDPRELDMSEVVGGAIKRRVDLNLIPIPFHPLPGN
ncbi:cytochrome P450 726A27-like [Euphorbia lathyris]|uniref:4,5,8-trihydroxycasbene synthase n=1 Tax=Euphorbia lathyris TaxID=212925 RepID=A0A165U614_EUPLT|nr:cytochrome P450 CYP726A29 [Euphorbia lathyris]